MGRHRGLIIATVVVIAFLVLCVLIASTSPLSGT